MDRNTDRFFWHSGDITFSESPTDPTEEEKKHAQEVIAKIKEKYVKGA